MPAKEREGEVEFAIDIDDDDDAMEELEPEVFKLYSVGFDAGVPSSSSPTATSFPPARKLGRGGSSGDNGRVGCARSVFCSSSGVISSGRGGRAARRIRSSVDWDSFGPGGRFRNGSYSLSSPIVMLAISAARAGILGRDAKPAL